MPGQPISTGPDTRLRLRLSGGTQLYLGAQAVTTIQRFESGAGELELAQGGLFCERPVGTPAVLRVRTPYCLVVVRSANFFVGPSRGVFGVFAQQGRVIVQARGRQVVLRKGEGTDIRALASGPTRPLPWKLPRIQEAITSVRVADAPIPGQAPGGATPASPR